LDAYYILVTFNVFNFTFICRWEGNEVCDHIQHEEGEVRLTCILVIPLQLNCGLYYGTVSILVYSVNGSTMG